MKTLNVADLGTLEKYMLNNKNFEIKNEPNPSRGQIIVKEAHSLIKNIGGKNVENFYFETTKRVDDETIWSVIKEFYSKKGYVIKMQKEIEFLVATKSKETFLIKISNLGITVFVTVQLG